MPGEADKDLTFTKEADELSDKSRMEEKELHGEESSPHDTHEHPNLRADSQNAHLLSEAAPKNPATHTVANTATTAESAFARLSQMSPAATSDAVDDQNQASALRKPAGSLQSQSQSNENKSLISTPSIVNRHDEYGQRRAMIEGLPYQSPYATAPAQDQTSPQAAPKGMGLTTNDTPSSWSVVPHMPKRSPLLSAPPRQPTTASSRYKSQRKSSRPAVSQDMSLPRVYRKLALKLPQSALMQPVPSQPTPSQPAVPLLVPSRLASSHPVLPRPVPSHLVPARAAPPPPRTKGSKPLPLIPLQPAFSIADALPGLLTPASKLATASSSTAASLHSRPRVSPNSFSASSASTLPPLRLPPSYAQEGRVTRSTAFSSTTGLKSSLSRSKKEAVKGPRKTVRFSDPVSAALPFDCPRYSPYCPVNPVSVGRQAPPLRAKDNKKGNDSGEGDDDDGNDSQLSAASLTAKSTRTGLSGGGRKPLRKRRRTSMPPSMTASPGSTYDTPYAAILPPANPDTTAAVSPPAAEVQRLGASSSPMSALSPTVSEQAGSMSSPEATTSARFASMPIPPFTPESAAFTRMLFRGLGTAPLSGWDASASPYPAGYFAGTAPLAPPQLQHQQRQSVAPPAPAVDWVSAPPSRWGTMDPVFYRWAPAAGAQESNPDGGSSPVASRESVDEWEAYDPQLWERASEQVGSSSTSFIEHWNSLSVGTEEEEQEQEVRASNTTTRRSAARRRSRRSQVVSSGVVRQPVSPVSPVRSSGHVSDEVPLLVSVHDFAVPAAPRDEQPASVQQSSESMPVTEAAAQPAPGAVVPTVISEQSLAVLPSSRAGDAPGGSQVASSALSGRDSSAAGAASTAHHGNGHKRSHDISSSDSDGSSSSSSFWAPQLDGTQDHGAAATGGAASLGKKRRRRLRKERIRQQRQKEEQEKEQQQKQDPYHDNVGDGSQAAHVSESCAVASVDTQAGSPLDSSRRQSHNMQAAPEVNFADFPSRNTGNLVSMHPDRHALLSHSGSTDTSLGNVRLDHHALLSQFGNTGVSLESMHPDRHALLSQSGSTETSPGAMRLDHHALPLQSGSTDISLESMHPDRHALLPEIVEQVVEDADDSDDETWTMHPERYARLQKIEESERARQASPIKIPTGPAKPLKIPAGPANPVKPPTGPAKTFKMPTGPANPVKIPTGPAKSIEVPTGPAKRRRRASRR